MKRTIIVLSLLFLSACATHNISQFEEIDSNNKTVLIRPGSLGFEGDLKQTLREEGFQLYVKSNEKDYAYAEKGKAKYELIARGNRYDHNIFTGEGKYNFDISFVNLKTSTEVFNYSGNAWAGAIDKKFKILIKDLVKKQ